VGGAPDRRLLIVAGEPSGDAHAARLVRALAGRLPCTVRGVAGPALAAAGATPVVPMRDLAVLGFSGVVRALPRLVEAWHRLIAEAHRFAPHAALLVDSPGFNFRVGPVLHRMGVPVFYYIAPQVWAWRPERAARMRAWVDRMAVVFPFEERIFRAAGVEATFVGHPLLDDLAAEVDGARLAAELELPAGTRLLGLLPGSRPQEVRAHLGTMLEAAAALRRDRPDLVTVVTAAAGVSDDDLTAAGLDPHRGDPRVRVVRDRTHAVQAHAHACAVASGTATLETALLGTPLVVVYRVGAVNYAIARRLVHLERIGLPNIVAGQDVAAELVQDTFTAPRLAAALAPLLDDPAAADAARRGLATVRERLGSPGASARAAGLLAEMLA